DAATAPRPAAQAQASATGQPSVGKRASLSLQYIRLCEYNNPRPVYSPFAGTICRPVPKGKRQRPGLRETDGISGLGLLPEMTTRQRFPFLSGARFDIWRVVFGASPGSLHKVISGPPDRVAYAALTARATHATETSRDRGADTKGVTCPQTARPARP